MNAEDASFERKEIRAFLIGHKSERALRFQTIAVRHLGPQAGIFARQLLFWDGRGVDPNGWTYKSINEFQDETGLSRRQQGRARKVLGGKGLMDELKKVGPDGRWRLFYRLNLPALVDLLGDDLTPFAGAKTLNPSSRVSGISEQGPCPVLPSSDYARYERPDYTEEYPLENPEDFPSGGESLRAPAGEKVSPREQDRKRSPSKATSPGNGTSSEGGLVKGLVSKLVRDLEAVGHFLSDSKRGRYAKGFKNLAAKDVSETDLHRVIARIVSEYDRIALMPEDAYSDLKGAGRRGSSGEKAATSATPEAGIRGLREWTDKNDRQRLAPFAQLAERFDFTSEEEPPWPILARLGQTEDERTRNLKSCRGISRRWVRESGDVSPSPATEEPAEGSTPDQLTEDDQRTIQRILEDPASTRAKELKARCVDDPDGLRYTQDLVDPVCIEAFGGRVRGPRELLIGQFVQVWIEREREAVVV